MNEIEIDGEKYKKFENRWVDSSYIIPPVNILRKIFVEEIQRTDTDNLGWIQFKAFIDETKKAECYDICLILTEKFVQKALTQNDIETVKYYISVKTSCLRNMNKPDLAIEYCKNMKQEYGEDILSVPTLTSLAAAYCDKEQWNEARQVCNHAYKKQGKNSTPGNELSMVYKRIDANNK